MAEIDLAKLVIDEYNSLQTPTLRANFLEYLSFDVASYCLECGNSIDFHNAVIGSDSFYFVCTECHEVLDMDSFLLNADLTKPVCCIFCTKDIQLWDEACEHCYTEFSTNFWLAYIATELQLNGYDSALPNEMLRKKYDELVNPGVNYNALALEGLRDNCFKCGVKESLCYCDSVFETFTLKDLSYFYNDEIASQFYSIGADLGSKLEYTCFNCKDYLTTNCKMMPAMMSSMVSKDNYPKFKVMTCEFQDPKEASNNF